jgi:hypothetical protein
MTAAHTTIQRKAKMSPEPGVGPVAWWKLLDSLHAATPIMLTRPLIKDENVARFSDNRWPLTLALHEAHAQALSIDWLTIDPRLRDEIKIYAWVLLNYEPTEHDALTGYSRIAVRTIARAVVVLRPFASFLLDQGRSSICETTNDDLERYVTSSLPRISRTRSAGMRSPRFDACGRIARSCRRCYGFLSSLHGVA